LVTFLSTGRANSGPVSDAVAVAPFVAATPGNTGTEVITISEANIGSPARTEGKRLDSGPREHLQLYLHAAAKGVPPATRNLITSSAVRMATAGQQTVPSIESDTEESDLPSTENLLMSTAVLPTEGPRFRQLFDTDRLMPSGATVSNYYDELAGRFPDADLWGQRYAVDLFGFSELSFDADPQDDRKQDGGWNEERIPAGAVPSDSDSSINGVNSQGSLHGRLMNAFHGDDLPVGAFVPPAARNADVPVRGLIPRVLRWAYHNPLLAGAIGGAFTLLLAAIVSRNTIQRPDRAV
jgi:hypothetical protein